MECANWVADGLMDDIILGLADDLSISISTCHSQVDGGSVNGGLQRTAPEDVSDGSDGGGCLDIAPNKLCIGLSLLICLLASYSIRNANKIHNNRIR